MLLLEYEGHAVSQDNYWSSTGAECLLTNKMQFAQLSPLFCSRNKKKQLVRMAEKKEGVVGFCSENQML